MKRMMKMKGMALFLVFALALTAVSGGGGISMAEAASRKVTVTKKLSLSEGEQAKIKVKAKTGYRVKAKKFRVSAGEPSGISVTKRGVVKGKKSGSYKVSVTVRYCKRKSLQSVKKAKFMTKVIVKAVTEENEDVSATPRTTAQVGKSSFSPKPGETVSTKSPGWIVSTGTPGYTMLPGSSDRPVSSNAPGWTTSPDSSGQPVFPNPSDGTVAPDSSDRPVTPDPSDQTASPDSSGYPFVPVESTGAPVSSDTPQPTEAPDIKVTDYTYEITPLLAPFNTYFYIKTDNPNPESFRFVDGESVYSKSGGSIEPITDAFSDVTYENADTGRVYGGYIATGSNTDGGSLKLQSREVTGTTPVYNITTGETHYEKNYAYQDTEVTIQLGELKDEIDYLISTYGDSSKGFFDNMDAIQSGLSSVCLYSGAYVRGELMKSTTTPYYGLSTSPHVDQNFYIQSPYYRKENRQMFITAIYPFIYDSIGFPSIMSSVARKLDSTAITQWSSSYHYIVEVTYQDETRSYGGAGSGGGKGIDEDQIMYRYAFDRSSDDASQKLSLTEVATGLREYGKLEVKDEETDESKLTWSKVRKTVGTDGSYVKLVALTSIFGGSTEAYSFLYDNGSTSEGSQGFASIGCMSNVWYDGRYFNNHEYYYPGATFEKTVEDVQPTLVFKDVTIKLPDDGKDYSISSGYKDSYDKETGVWKGFTKYRYDSESKVWKADMLNRVQYKDADGYHNIDNEDFIDQCTITMDEALNMNLDRNTDKDPDGYYVYDRVTEPGTWQG